MIQKLGRWKSCSSARVLNFGFYPPGLLSPVCELGGGVGGIPDHICVIKALNLTIERKILIALGMVRLLNLGFPRENVSLYLIKDIIFFIDITIWHYYIIFWWFLIKNSSPPYCRDGRFLSSQRLPPPPTKRCQSGRPLFIVMFRYNGTELAQT